MHAVAMTILYLAPDMFSVAVHVDDELMVVCDCDGEGLRRIVDRFIRDEE